MAYVDYDFYLSGYLLGKSPSVSEEEFPYWERQAETVLNQYTNGRLNDVTGTEESVRLCLCELAELYCRADKAMGEDGSGLLSSFSNDGESGTFELSESPYTETGKKQKAGEIIRRNLFGSGLLYRGIR